MDLFKVRNILSNGISIYDIPLRVTFYSRVSTCHDEQINSLKNQTSYFEEIIKNNSKWEYCNGYIDEGITGTIDKKRSSFMNMIRDAKNNMFDLILTKEISRFSRNTLDSIKYTRELLNYGVAVYFLNDNINTTEMDSELRLTIMASLAQDEVRKLSERVKFGMKRSIKNGHILGNDLLYGYKKNRIDNSLTIESYESNVVKRLFTLYGIKGMSLHSIANIFNEEGIRTSLNKRWSVTTLSRMIRNPKYKGYYCGGKSEVIDYMSKIVKKFDIASWIMYEDKKRIPPIVDEYLFDIANNRLNSSSKTMMNKIIKYPLSSKMICLNCGQVLLKRMMSKRGTEVVWFCKNKQCKTNIRESEMEYILVKCFNLYYEEVKHILLESYNSFDNMGFTNEIKNEIENINLKKDKLLELSVGNFIGNLEFKEKNEYYNCLLESLNNKFKNCEKGLVDYRLLLNDYFKKNTFLSNLISVAIKNIEVTYINPSNVSLMIETNIKDFKPCKEKFQFKRGYDVVGTRRYLFNVIVYIN